MQALRTLFLAFLGLSILSSSSLAKKGFSIEGGLIFDRPARTSHDRPYANMKGGLGFIGNVGYDLFERGGLEIGAMHSSHHYELGIRSGVVLEETATKTAFFVKARAIPLQKGKFEIATAAGIGYFDISGKRLDSIGNALDEYFSGIGFTGNIDTRYHITDALAASFYLGLNLVNYSRYEIFGYKADFGRPLPGGDSINWGLTLYHHIGIPQL
jgi:RNase P/RNase MRP subunit p29